MSQEEGNEGKKLQLLPIPKQMVASKTSLQVYSLAGCDTFIGTGIPTAWHRLYGGQTLGQSVLAACQTVEDEYPIHSLHSYFILPGDSNKEILFEVDRVRDGRSFKTRACKAIQGNRVICLSQMSFHKNEQGFVLESSLRDLIPPSEHHVLNEDKFKDLENGNDWENIDKRKLFEDKKNVALFVMKSKVGISKTNWRANCAMLSFLSDMGLIWTVRNMYSEDTPWMIPSSSLDHSIHFHKPTEIFTEEWNYFCMIPRAYKGNRALICCYIYNMKEELVATVSQEALIRVYDETKDRRSSKL